VEALVLLGAGVLAGLSGTMAGLASLFSYPALLAVGLAPVAANVTNTVSLTLCTVGAGLGSRPELTGQRGNVRRFGLVAAVGGAVGALLLLTTPGEAFELIVPFLIAGAATVLLVQPRLQGRLAERRPDAGAGPGALGGVFAIGVYGGYFGAAAGVLMLALLGVVLAEPLLRVNALKTMVLGFANGVAALGFAVFGPVDWIAAVPLSLGLVAGSVTGPWLLRRLPAATIRVAVCLAGYGLAIRLLATALG
jgi:uncharacterized membrane protein YfcA